MANLNAGGRIPGHVSLTLQADNVSLVQWEPVHVTTSYKCVKADGSKPVVGFVKAIYKEVPSTGGDRVADPNGNVSVESTGFAVVTLPAGAALATAGVKVGINAAGKVAAPGAGVADIGILLTSAAAEDDDVDVLLTGAA